MALWPRLIGGPGGDPDEFHGLMFPFYMAWQYGFLRDRIEPRGDGAALSAEDFATVDRILAMDAKLYPTLGNPFGIARVGAAADMDHYKANVLRHVLYRDVYSRHRLQVWPIVVLVAPPRPFRCIPGRARY